MRETLVAHTTHGDSDEHVMTSTGGMLTTFAVLAIIAAIQLGIGFADLGPNKVIIALLVAVAQAGVLVVFFMDLRQADKLTLLTAGAAVFWVGLLFLFILTDYLTRHLAVL